MKCVVVIPVGPGHEQLAGNATESVVRSWDCERGPFDEIEIFQVPDPAGALGRSRARNIGLEQPADWHFLLDADDEMLPGAFAELDQGAPATFGAIYFRARRYHADVYPCTRDTLFQHGARGTLSMGCFVRGDLGLRFDESLDVGEDFDFYLRLPGFTKRRDPLVSIGYDHPSAVGPRGYVRADWVGTCNRVIERYRSTYLGGRSA